MEARPKTVYQIKVVVLETEPPIWRRFVVPSGVTLHRLHLILQDVMGWTNSHLYRFCIETEEYGEPHPDNEFSELDFKNSRQTKIEQVATKESSIFQYEYDFGDSWTHMLLVEGISEGELEKAIRAFIDYYNYRRYHEGLGNVTPYDVYTGRYLKIIQKRKEAKSRTLAERKNYNRIAREQGGGL